MDQLVAPDAKWDFVRENMDGFVMHFGFWLNNDYKGDPIGVGKKLGAQLNPLSKNWMMEVGWPGVGMEDHFADMGQWYGEKHAAQIQKFARETGIVTNEISCDLRLFAMQRVAAHFPDYNAADVYQQVTGDAPNYPADGPVKAPYWPAYMRAMNRELPAVKIHVTFPSVYMPWDEFSGAGKNFDFTSPRNGQMKFKGRDFMTSLFKENLAGFIADSPYNIMMNPKYIAQGYLEKEISLQTWLHGGGAQFSHIINGKPDAKLAPAEWDAKYKEMSLESLHKFQAAGGRADRYIFESWHIGPYKIAPEAQEGTFANLVMDAIKYLKGTGQKLDLSVTAPDGKAPIGMGVYDAKSQQIATAPGSYAVTLKNEGEVACMPTVRAPQNAIRYSVDGQDVSAQVQSDEGYVFTKMVAPGASVNMTVKVEKGASATQLQAFWNPQDGAAPRDVIGFG